MDRRTFMGAVAAAGGTGAATSVTVATRRAGNEIELFSDEYGVSHVYADDLYGLGYGNGYVQARDRLFQMDVLRLVGRGESALIQGPSQFSSDVQVTRDLYDRAARTDQWEAAHEDVRDMIRGFTDGVNDRMDELDESGDMPGEFDLLQRDPEPWEPEDTVAVVNYTVGFFGVGGGSELSNAKRLATMFDRMDDERAAWKAYGDLNGTVVSEDHYGSLSAGEYRTTDDPGLAYEDVTEGQLAAIRAAAEAEPWGIDEVDHFDVVVDGLREAVGLTSGSGFGSNAIVVGGEHTETGHPMLGGGPQMGLFKPPIVYEVGLHGDGLDAVGIGVVGAPAIVVGRTPEFAWTVTTAGDDMVDTVAVDLDPEDRYRYRWDGEWHEMNTETIVHEANAIGGLLEGRVDPAEIHQEVALVEQAGTEMPVVAWNESANVAYCQRVAPRKEELDAVFRWAEIARADDLDGIEDRLAEFPFGFNFHVVDRERVAFYRTGKLPRRSGTADPRFPTPADDHAWEGYDVGTDIGASVVDPERGYVVNWNNAPGPGWRASDGEVQWDGLHRVDVLERFTRDAIERTGGSLTLDDVEGIIADCSVHHPFAPGSTPHLIEAGRESDDAQLRAMAEELDRWAETDYSFDPAGADTYANGGMAIWEETRFALQELVFGDEMGERTPELVFDPTAGDGIDGGFDPHVADHGGTNTWDLPLVTALNGRTEHEWIPSVAGADDGGSHDERRLAVCRTALDRAASVLEDRFDSADPGEWRMEVRRGAFTPLGGATSSEVAMTNRATYQQSVAMRGGEAEAEAYSVLPPGNSATLSFGEVLWAQLFGSEPDELTDQLDLYADFDYKPHPVDRETVERRATSESRVTPGEDEGEDDGSWLDDLFGF